MTDADSVKPTARQELVEEYERGKRYSLDDLRMSQRHCQAQGREITELRIELAKAKLAAVSCEWVKAQKAKERGGTERDGGSRMSNWIEWAIVSFLVAAIVVCAIKLLSSFPL